MEHFSRIFTFMIGRHKIFSLSTTKPIPIFLCQKIFDSFEHNYLDRMEINLTYFENLKKLEKRGYLPSSSLRIDFPFLKNKITVIDSSQSGVLFDFYIDKKDSKTLKHIKKECLEPFKNIGKIRDLKL